MKERSKVIFTSLILTAGILTSMAYFGKSYINSIGVENMREEMSLGGVVDTLSNEVGELVEDEVNKEEDSGLNEDSTDEENNTEGTSVPENSQSEENQATEEEQVDEQEAINDESTSTEEDIAKDEEHNSSATELQDFQENEGNNKTEEYSNPLEEKSLTNLEDDKQEEQSISTAGVQYQGNEDNNLSTYEVNHDLDIKIQVTAVAHQTLKINKYFKNAFTVDWGDGSDIAVVSSDTGHTYTTGGTKIITLSLTGTEIRWKFRTDSRSLGIVPKRGTTVTNVKIIAMPSLEEGFGESSSNPGDGFFSYFNNGGAITSLPAGSFRTEYITEVGNSFFAYFNGFSNGIGGEITSLPTGSFRTENITKVGNSFFSNFNNGGKLTSLPEGSFRTENITKVGNSFFSNFNNGGKLPGLPTGSFRTENITAVGNYFFYGFNNNGQLTSLPAGSFNIGSITAVGNYFFYEFNRGGQLTSLPAGSFNTEDITEVGDYFFAYFNQGGSLTSLPEGSFRTENITEVGNYFFAFFNDGGAICLPDSFELNPIGLAANNGYYEAFDNSQCQITITFNANGGDIVPKPIKNTINTSIMLPNIRSEQNRFLGWYTLSQGGERAGGANDEYITTKNMTLYARWESCPNGYKGYYDRCIPLNAGVFYEDGYIRISYGDDSIYLKEKNAGAEDSMYKSYQIQKLIDEYKMCQPQEPQRGLKSDNSTISIKNDDEEQEFFSKVTDIIEDEVDSCEQVQQYLDDAYPSTVGYFYFWGNNTGAAYDELYINGNYIYLDNNEDLYNRGFDGGKFLENDDEWEKGDNPCNEEEGEYLPTVSDWQKALEIRSEIQGYNMNYEDYGDHGYISYNTDFLGDILIKKPDQGGDLIAESTVDMRESVYYYGGLWASIDKKNNNMGTLDSDRLNYQNVDYTDSYNFNRLVMPVRCFLDPDYLTEGKKYLVTFKDGEEVLFTKEIREGKVIKNVKNPTKENYGFVGWYTDKKLRHKFDMETPITGAITLYAKWGEKGVYHRNGYIKVTNGEKTIYLKDRNVGATVSQGLPEFGMKQDLIYAKGNQLSQKYGWGSDEYNSKIIDYAKEILGIEFDNVRDMWNYLENPLAYEIYGQIDILECRNQDSGCDDEEILTVINNNLDKNFTNIDDAYDYVDNYYSYNPLYGENDNDSFGKYYFRGNNNGAKYNDLEFEDKYDPHWITNNLDQDFIAGSDYTNEGWESGNTDNPCNGEGEYLPSGEDWKELMELWGNIKGYRLQEDSYTEHDNENNEYNIYDYFYDDRPQIYRFMNDMLIPKAGYIYKDSNYWNDNIQQYEERIGYYYDGALQTSLTGNYIGRFGEEGLYNWHKNLLIYWMNSLDAGDGAYLQAYPVRCFLNIEEPEDAPTYTVSFITNGGSTITSKEVEEGYKLNESELNTSKAGYVFLGWYIDSSLTTPYNFNDVVEDDLILYAKWGTEIPTLPNYSGGAGRPSINTAGDSSKEHNAADKRQESNNKQQNITDRSTQQKEGQTKTLDSKQSSTRSNQTLSSYYNHITKEDNDAYVRAREKNITTQSPDEANPNGYVTRGEMAKMVVNFALNVLGMKLPEHYPQCAWDDDVKDWGGKELKSYGAKSCALGIMGINMKTFYPKRNVTRAEFGTILSRMLWGDSFNVKDTKERPYYTEHLKALKANGIMENIKNPTVTKEVRKWVWTMMKRTVKDK